MVIIEGNCAGSFVIEQDTSLRGNVRGDVVVGPGCYLEMRGNLMGDIVLQGDARVDVRGNLAGAVRRIETYA